VATRQDNRLRGKIVGVQTRENILRAENCQSQISNKGLSIIGLLEAKKAAFKHRVWFRVLNRVERGIVDLTMRYVDEIKSAKLAKVLTAIMEKLAQATESIADRLVRTVGVPLAKKMSIIAVTWGNVSASEWAEDTAFARYLIFCWAKT
jgi:hypothetical protein